jgi:hypothetical protein
VCSTIGDGFCGCWACAAPNATAQISSRRMRRNQPLRLAALSFAKWL